ncbi:amidohydrolase family protein [Nonomuraea fuscirosea]
MSEYAAEIGPVINVAHVNVHASAAPALADLAATSGLTPAYLYDLRFTLPLRPLPRTGLSALYRYASDQEHTLRQHLDEIGVGSDNGTPVGLEHPRTWGCFPRFFGTYVRERRLLPLEEAVRKATSATADQFALHGRGWLGPGSWADVCVFDPDTIGHSGTYADPSVQPSGIAYVLLEGFVVVESGEFTGERRGRVLRAGQ